MIMSGNIPKGAGKYTERYATLIEGARIVPYDTSQSLTINGTIITDDEQEGIACFDRSPLSANTVVDINYVPPQVEVIVVDSGGGDGSISDADKNDIRDRVWSYTGPP